MLSGHQFPLREYAVNRELTANKIILIIEGSGGSRIPQIGGGGGGRKGSTPEFGPKKIFCLKLQENERNWTLRSANG